MCARAMAGALWLGVLPAPSLVASEPIVLLMPGVRREIAPAQKGSVERLPLDALLSGLGVAVAHDPRAVSVRLVYQGREVGLFHGKNLASLGGDLRLLSAECLYEDGRWLVPVDAVPRLIGPLLGQPAEWRAGARVLVLGQVRVPRVRISTRASGDAVRVVLEASEKLSFRVEQGAQRVLVSMAHDLVDVAFQGERPAGGIVDSIDYEGGRGHVLAVALGRRFRQLHAAESQEPSRLVLDFLAAAPPAAAGEPSGRAAAPVASGGSAPPVPAPAPRIVVIDPGHGGSDQGARGPGGAIEKDVTLAIARKLRASIASSLGVQAFLTRERDEDLPLEQRAPIANNYKADVFVSIHANSSRGAGASGAEVYFLSYQASDEDSRRVAVREGAIGEAVAAAAPPGESDLALILWDMAQAAHLEESSALASRIQEELATLTGSQGRGVKQAPFRVLVGATMPAVLVEVAFISNPEEEKLLASDAWQGRLAQALTRGIGRFLAEQARRAGAGLAATPPGS